MIKKTTKKTAVKKPVKKTVAKKQPVMSAKPVNVPMESAHGCPCGCHCGCKHRFFALLIKIIILCIVFLLGILSAPWFMHRADMAMMRNIAFDDNGCVVLETVKCPKLLETLATADDNADGCISKSELSSAIAELHNPQEPMAE